MTATEDVIRDRTIREVITKVVETMGERGREPLAIDVIRAMKGMLTGREVLPPMEQPVSYLAMVQRSTPAGSTMAVTTPLGQLTCTRYMRGSGMICSDFALDGEPMTRAELVVLGLDQKRRRKKM